MPEGTGTPPADGSAGNPQSGTGEPPKPPETPRKLDITQEELDRIIADRVARAKPKDYDELLKLKADHDAAEEAKKTELQKEKDARAAAEQAAKEKNSRADAKLKRAAILTEAAAQNAADADIVVALLMGEDGITINDEGEVAGVKEAVKKLLKDKPVLAKAAASRSGAEFGGNDPASTKEKIAQLEAKANDLKLPSSERRAARQEARILQLRTYNVAQ